MNQQDETKRRVKALVSAGIIILQTVSAVALMLKKKK